MEVCGSWGLGGVSVTGFPRLRRGVDVPLPAGFAVNGRAQQLALDDRLLDAMTGQWVLRGEIRKTPTVHDVDVLVNQRLEIAAG